MSLIFKHLYFLSFVAGIFFCGHVSLDAEGLLSPATEKAVSQFRKLDLEIDFGYSLPEKLLRCSYLQDAWITYLQEAENQQDFLLGMAEIDQLTDQFRDNLNYAATVVNFFNPGTPRKLFPQEIELGHQTGFLNTFKKGRDLTEQERAEFFGYEWSQYEEESTSEPFCLDITSLDRLESGKIYNFALLPDGTIRIALEKPGGKDYLSNEEIALGDFAYPNHTILAGGPHQALLSAGSLILYRVEDKQLMFVSNKSGHFVPSYSSLRLLKKQLNALGFDPHSVITVPTVDLSDAVLSIYNTVQIPVSLMQEDAERLFLLAHQRWINALNQIDLQLLTELSQGASIDLSRPVIAELNRIREEGTYMRSAYQIFTESHEAPKLFHKFVKRFGILKDAIKHNIKEEIIAEAKWIVKFLQENGNVLMDRSFAISQEASLYNYLRDEINTIKNLISKDLLPIDEFHLIKKMVRELGSLFLSLSEDAFESGHKFSIYRAAAKSLLCANQHMAAIHDEQVGKIMRKEVQKSEIVLEMPQSIKSHINKLLDQLGIAPPVMEIKIEEKTVFMLINEAKDWYFYHYLISCHPDEHIYGVSLPYDPSPNQLLTKLINGDFTGQHEEDLDAIKLLKITLRNAEIAKNALIFLDKSHSAPEELDVYTSCLKKILRAIEKNDPSSVAVEAATMLEFMSLRGTPTLALEHYRCTDQDSFNKALKTQISILEKFQEYILSSYLAEKILENVQTVADLMNLYLLLGQKYHTLPTAAYEETLHDCEILIEELQHQVKYAESEDQVTITPKLKSLANRLLKKFNFNDSSLVSDSLYIDI